MAEPTLELLQAMVQKVLDNQQRQDHEFHDIKLRLASLEQGQSTIIRQTGGLVETDARIQASLDRLAERVDRLERRLDIAG